MADPESFPKWERIALYRRQAEEARQSATVALTNELRADYERLAEGWEKLADDLDRWR